MLIGACDPMPRPIPVSRASTGYVNVVPAGYETVELPGFNLRGSSPDLDPLSAYETVEPDEVVDHFLREQHG